MIAAVDSAFAFLAPNLGLSKDHLKLIAILYAAVPLCAILKRLPDGSPNLKNVFNIAVSLFFLIGVYDLWGGLCILLLSAVGTYFIAFNLRTPWMPWIAFIFVMGLMSVSHIIRQVYGTPDGVVDYTGPQMVLCQKLTAFAWNVYDGRQDLKTLLPWQKERAILSPPSFLDYLGYVLFFPGLMVGPYFDFAEYKRWVTLSMFDVVLPSKSSKTGTSRKRRIPRSGLPATVKLVEGTAWLVLFSLFSRWYSISFALSDEFLQYGFLRRLWYIQPLGLTHRFKFYGVWKMAEGACILSGIGFNGYKPDGSVRWDRVTNISPLALETAQNSKEYLEAWNQNTNKWLRSYVYLRVTPRGKKPGFKSSMQTFITSAIWHGFYPGYYLTFISGGFIQTCGKYYRRHLRPFFFEADLTTPTKYKRYYDFVCWTVTQQTFNYVGQSFIILTIWDSFRLWGRLYFYIHVGMAVTFIFLHGGGKKLLDLRLIKHVKRRNSMSKHEVDLKESKKNAEKGVYMVPPMPESIKI